jgi:hypothetical protein
MEPPAKRLRILKSIEVDESNPDYIAAKEKQRAKLKGRFESLYAKYEALPEAMTDEIDIRTGEIVVDRGHMRKLNREYMQQQGKRGRGSGELLDDLFRDEPKDLADDNESTEENVRDELAPSQSPEPRSRKQAAPKHEPPPTEHASGPHTSPGHPTTHASMPLPFTPSGPAITSVTQATVPNMSSPSMNWMQLVQFPQTPAGQIAQSAFLQQIQHAVQQAITPILSTMLSIAPTSAQPDTNAITTPFGPTAIYNETTPALLPKLRSPPHPRSSDAPIPTQSSPLRLESSDAPIAPPSSPPAEVTSPPRRRFLAKGVYIEGRRNREGLPPARSNGAAAHSDDPPQARITEINRSQSWADTSQVEEEDSTPPKRIPASGSSVATDAKTHPQITQTQRKPGQTRPRKVKKQARKIPVSKIFKMSSTTCPLHLPTPESLEQDEIIDVVEQPQNLPVHGYETLIASGSHFDDDERDLLSIADMDTSLAQEDDMMEEIVPSIENELPMDYDGMIQTTSTVPTKSDPIPKAEPPHPVSSPVPPASSSNKPRKKLKAINFQVDSDSEDDLDLVADSPSEGGRSSHNTYPNVAKNGRGRPRKAAFVNSLSNSTPLISSELSQNIANNDDELLAPVTPKIKHESCTPPPLNFLRATPTLHTPRSAPQPSKLQSSGAEEKATPLARSVFLKQVKQSWAKGNRKVGPGPKKGAKSMFSESLKRKRALWEDGAHSEDELAM